MKRIAKHDNEFTSKAENKETYDAVRAGLVKLRKHIENIEKQRRANGKDPGQAHFDRLPPADTRMPVPRFSSFRRSVHKCVSCVLVGGLTDACPTS